jgi:lactate dehydrogenase-like 2-hydroxyacid dehydrogenase
MEFFGSPEDNTKLFKTLENLKVVSTVSAGYDHLDVKYLHERGIKIGHTPGGVAEGTSDQVNILKANLIT